MIPNPSWWKRPGDYLQQLAFTFAFFLPARSPEHVTLAALQLPGRKQKWNRQRESADQRLSVRPPEDTALIEVGRNRGNWRITSANRASRDTGVAERDLPPENFLPIFDAMISSHSPLSLSPPLTSRSHEASAKGRLRFD